MKTKIVWRVFYCLVLFYVATGSFVASIIDFYFTV